MPDRYAESEKRDGCIVIRARGKSAKFDEVGEVINVSYSEQYRYNLFAARNLINWNSLKCLQQKYSKSRFVFATLIRDSISITIRNINRLCILYKIWDHRQMLKSMSITLVTWQAYGIRCHARLKADTASTLETVFYTFDSPYQVNISRYDPPMSTATTHSMFLYYSSYTHVVICLKCLTISVIRPGSTCAIHLAEKQSSRYILAESHTIIWNLLVGWDCSRSMR